MKETQIRNMEIGSTEIKIDAFSNFKIKGEVLSFHQLQLLHLV